MEFRRASTLRAAEAVVGAVDACVCGGDNPATSERCGFAHGMVQVKVLDTISAETRAARSRSLATLNSLEMATRCPRVIRLLSR